MKKGVNQLEKALRKEKIVAMLAPSFIAEFSFPSIISQLKLLGFEKVIELTFGAKMVNREYHKILSHSSSLVIASTCPGITETIRLRMPEYNKNLAKVDSPMIASSKICKHLWKNYKTCFISPCNFKKIEAANSDYVDYAIDYQELRKLFLKNNIKESKQEADFDKFYNEYTRIYPLSGGLSKTAHLKGVINAGEEKIIDGIQDVLSYLQKPDRKVKFLDCTFCKGGCLGGPYISEKNLDKKKKKLKEYLDKSKNKSIPKIKKGIIKRAEGISFIKQ